MNALSLWNACTVQGLSIYDMHLQSLIRLCMLRQVWNLGGFRIERVYRFYSVFFVAESGSAIPVNGSCAPRIITAVSDFVIMYTTELWVFTGGLTRRGGHAPCCSLLRGYFICFRLLAWIGSHSFSSRLTRDIWWSMMILCNSSFQVSIKQQL